MPLKLPPAGHSIWSLIDEGTVRSLTPELIAKLQTLPQARTASKAFFKQAAPWRAVFETLVLSKDGRVLLVGLDRKGNFKVRWSFGRI